MRGAKNTGFKDDEAVQAAVDKHADTTKALGDLPDIEAAEDMREAVTSIAARTSHARIRGDQDYEKTLTFERGKDDGIVISSLGLPGKQGGSVPGVRRSTEAVAHVHYPGLGQQPFGLDYTPVKAGIPSFVISGETGAVWEVGRQHGRYVQRTVGRVGKVGSWVAFPK